MCIAGYPPAVNASFARCDGHTHQGTGNTAVAAQRRRLFDGLPQNQAKVMTGYTDGNDKALAGNFNWTFSLAENLAVRFDTSGCVLRACTRDSLVRKSNPNLVPPVVQGAGA
eukprot:SAG31_NODE_992_length_10517_cov_6.577942_10_plen_112_part_00